MGSEKLRMVDGDAAGEEIPLDTEFVVGRGESGMGNLAEDPEISRRHARFGRDESGALIVEDLGSTTGTYVNGSASPVRTSSIRETACSSA